MGTTSARQCAMILDNATWVIAIELLNAAQALDFHAPIVPGPGVGAARAALRHVVPPLETDRMLTPDLEAVRSIMLDDSLRGAVEAAIGVLA